MCSFKWMSCVYGLCLQDFPVMFTLRKFKLRVNIAPQCICHKMYFQVVVRKTDPLFKSDKFRASLVRQCVLCFLLNTFVLVLHDGDWRRQTLCLWFVTTGNWSLCEVFEGIFMCFTLMASSFMTSTLVMNSETWLIQIVANLNGRVPNEIVYSANSRLANHWTSGMPLCVFIGILSSTRPAGGVFWLTASRKTRLLCFWHTCTTPQVPS